MSIYLYCTCVGECRTHWTRYCKTPLMLGDVDNICEKCVDGKERVLKRKVENSVKNKTSGIICAVDNGTEDDCICGETRYDVCTAETHWTSV